MHKNLPAGPSSRLSLRYNEVSLTRVDISDGIKLLNMFELRYKEVSDVRVDNWDGIGLLRLLPFRYKLVNLFNTDTC